MDDFDLGARLRQMRQRKGLSQRDLAQAAGVPHGQISMIETNRSSPSVASLRRILSGMSMTMAEFFGPGANRAEQVFFTPADRTDLTGRMPGNTRVRIEQLGETPAQGLQILHETHEPGADTESRPPFPDTVKGGIVISGEIEVTVGDQTRVLRAGDGYLFPANRPHRFRNLSDAPAIIVAAHALARPGSAATGLHANAGRAPPAPASPLDLAAKYPTT